MPTVAEQIAKCVFVINEYMDDPDTSEFKMDLYDERLDELLKLLPRHGIFVAIFDLDQSTSKMLCFSYYYKDKPGIVRCELFGPIKVKGPAKTFVHNKLCLILDSKAPAELATW